LRTRLSMTPNPPDATGSVFTVPPNNPHSKQRLFQRALTLQDFCDQNIKTFFKISLKSFSPKVC